MLSYDEYVISETAQVTDALFWKQKTTSIDHYNMQYDLYKMAYSLVQMYTLLDDTSIDDNVLIGTGILAPLTVKLFNNSLTGANTESTSNDGITKSKSFSSVDLLEPYKQYLQPYRKIKLL